MPSFNHYARAFDRSLRRLLPPSWKPAARHALAHLINLKKELPALLGKHSHVVSLVAQTKEGLVTFDARDRGVGWIIAYEGEWEREESERLREIVTRGDLVIDVGANIGWYSLMLSARVGDDGLVVAFEPEPRNYQLLVENIRLNGRGNRVRTFELALMSEDGDVEFELSDENFGDHRVRLRAPDAGSDDQRYSESLRRVTRVKGRKLDAVLESEKLGTRTIRLMKIDCQGAEPTVVAGAARALQRTAFLAIEYWPYGMRRAGFDPSAFVHTLSRHFDSFAVLHDAGGLYSFQSTSALPAHAATVSEHTDYLLRNSTLLNRA